MLLNAETFQDLVASLAAQAKAARVQRRSERIKVQRPSTILVSMGANQPVQRQSVTLRDVSEEGMMMHHHTAMNVGQSFLIELPRPNGAVATLLCTVKHSKQLGDGQFAIGSAFTRDLSDAREAAKDVSIAPTPQQVDTCKTSSATNSPSLS